MVQPASLHLIVFLSFIGIFHRSILNKALGSLLSQKWGHCAAQPLIFQSSQAAMLLVTTIIPPLIKDKSPVSSLIEFPTLNNSATHQYLKYLSIFIIHTLSLINRFMVFPSSEAALSYSTQKSQTPSPSWRKQWSLLNPWWAAAEIFISQILNNFKGFFE